MLLQKLNVVKATNDKAVIAQLKEQGFLELEPQKAAKARGVPPNPGGAKKSAEGGGGVEGEEETETGGEG